MGLILGSSLSTLLSTINLAPATAQSKIPSTAVNITRINIARQGGDALNRWVTFVVPDRSTAVPAYGGSLRLYDVHIAKMIEITLDQFCTQPATKGAYFNYEADNGRIFMGKLFISCDIARQAKATYGLGRAERTILEYAGNPEVVYIPVLDLNGPKIKRFQNFISTAFLMGCIETGTQVICPGDRLD
ncbi:MAG: hypothetical protein WCO45_06600 [Pseudanabaena sp. ELA607]